MNRRVFIRTGCFALAGTSLLGAAPRAKKKVLVTIFQRGAVDGLNMIVPYAESAYYAARRSIAIPRNEVLDLDGFFGAHPALASLQPFWRERSLAVVHAAGSPDASRSHFDAQDFMESGTPGIKSTKDGFLARALAMGKSPNALRAMSLTQTMPRILAGSDAIATTSLARFGNDRSAELLAALYPESRPCCASSKG